MIDRMPGNSVRVKQTSQGGLALWHGMRIKELLQLFRMKPHLTWSHWNRIALLPGMACYNSAMGALERLLYGPAVEKTAIQSPPVFVLGFWRSGTTLLHQLLSLDPACTSPNMYQTLFPWHFLLTETVVSKATAWLLPSSRPMDNVALSWDAPQEDEIALCIMSLLSPYAFLATPQDFREFWRTLDLSCLTDVERALWKHCLLLLMKKVTMKDPRRLIMKSPSHTYRIPILLEMFPDAKFVYIQRNPHDVFKSAVHLRRTMIRENVLGTPEYRDPEGEILRSYKVCFDKYERDRERIPPGNLHELRFEDLEKYPIQEIEKLYSTLSLPGFEVVREILEKEEPKLRQFQKNVFNPDPHWAAEVSNELQPAFTRFGYLPDPDPEANGDSTRDLGIRQRISSGQRTGVTMLPRSRANI